MGLTNEEVRTIAAEAGRPAWTDGQSAFIAHRHSDRVEVTMRGREVEGWRNVPVGQARDYDLLRLNNDLWLNFLAVDVDGEGDNPQANGLARAIDCEAEPTVVVATPHGAHAVWAIESVRRGHWKSTRFALDVQWNLCRVLDGDRAYSAYAVRSPLYVGAEAYWGELEPYSLGELREALADNWAFRNPFRQGQPVVDPGEGRNAALYSALLKIDSTDEGELFMKATQLNQANPLPLSSSELRSVVRSVTRRRSPGGEASAWFIEQGRKGGAVGGRRNTPAQTTARIANLAGVNQAKALQASARRGDALQMIGLGFSRQEVLDTLGVSRATLHRYLKSAA